MNFIQRLPLWVKVWKLAAFFATCTALLVYGTMQYNLRANANDPQIGIAEGLSGAPLTTLQNSFGKNTPPIDIAHNLSTFVMIFDAQGNVVIGNAELNGGVPTLPRGVLDYTKLHGEDRVTWEPQKGVRIAAVAVARPDGYVVVGRSLREVELQETELLYEVLIAWVVMILGALVLSRMFFARIQQ